MNRFALMALGALVLAAGCSGGAKVPKTYPVSGKVLQADGKPMTGGVVQFVPKNNLDVTTSGEIQADGSFTLSTVAENKKVTGATEGPHTVTVLPPVQSQKSEQGSAPPAILIPEAYTVKSDGENNFTINIPKGR
jgi:hypothetical protein